MSSPGLPASVGAELPVYSYALPLAAVAAAVGALAVVSPALALTAVAAMLFVAAAFRDLALGVALFIPLAFMQGLSTSIRPALGAAGVILVFAALRRRRRPLLPRESPALAYAILLLAAWGVSSTLWATNLGASAFPALQLMLVIALMVVVFTAVSERRHVRWIVWSYIAGAALSALASFLVPAAELGRVTGGKGDPNFLAATVVSGLALVLFALAATKGLLAKWILASCALLFVTTLFMTQSRGGLVALGGLVAGAIVLAGPLRPHAIAFTFMIVALAIGYYGFVASPEAVSRLTHLEGGSGRDDIWSIAAHVAADHPITGVGIGNFRVVEASYAARTVELEAVRQVVDERLVVHNTYLQILAELGAVGLTSFTVVVVSSVLLGLRAVRSFVRSRDSESEIMTRGVIVAIISLLTAFVFLSGQYDKQLWLLLGLAAASASVARRTTESVDRTSE